MGAPPRPPGEPATSLAAATLTPAQQDTITHFQGYGVPATWFISEPRPDGSVEVVALGEGFVWSLSIATDGDHVVSEAPLGEFSTGIEV